MITQDFIGYIICNNKVLTDKNKIKISGFNSSSISKILLGFDKLILYPIEDLVNKISVKDYCNESFIPIVEIVKIIFDQEIIDYDIINNNLFYGIEFDYLGSNAIFAYWIEDCEFNTWWSDKEDAEYGDYIELKNMYKIYDFLNRFHIDYRKLIDQNYAINAHSFDKDIY